MSQLDHVLQDARFAIRQLRRSPGFTVIAVFTLALGLCASVAIFALVDAALIKPLPYRSSSRLVGVFESVPMFPQSNLSYLDYLDWKKLNRVFASLAAYQGSGLALTTPAGAERVPGARVSDDFFRTLGVTPILGRDFRPGEDLPSAPRTIVLSYAAWQKRYGGGADVLGRTVTLNGDSAAIVGVLPRDFHFAPAEPVEFWTTLHATNPCDLRRSCHNLYGVARLRDGISVETAAANIASIAKELERQYPESNRGQGSAVVPLSEVITGNIRPVLLVLLAGAVLLMLIATVNVASLLVVRSERRRREIAVRRALGASSWRVVGQFATEGLLLVGVGAAIGLASAYSAAGLLTGLVPANIIARMPYLHDLGPNVRVSGFAAAMVALEAVVFAITPMAHLSLVKIQEGLAEGSRGTAGLVWRRVGSQLIVIELATAMVLLSGAGLLGKSLYRLLQVDIGLKADHLVTLGIAAPSSGYSTNDQQAALGREIVGRIAALPGVRSAGISSRPPMLGGNTMWIRVVGRPYHGEHNEVLYREVSSGYFRTLGARVLRGRDFTDEDDQSTPPVVVINQALATQYFAGEDPIGKQLLYASFSSQPPMEIVGIVADIKENALDVATAPTLYVSFAQDPTPGFAVVVRTTQAEQTLLPTLSAAIHDIDPGITTFAGRTMTEVINESQAAYVRRSSASLVGGFAATAWLLGIIGLYGVVAYSVSQRTREVGVRMALGAERGSVCELILRDAIRLIGAGLALGVAASVLAATLMRGLLFGVPTWDVPTLAAGAGVLGLSALLASYIPARRAASLNPVDALRAE